MFKFPLFRIYEQEHANYLKIFLDQATPMTHMNFWPSNLSFGSFELIWGQMRFCL